MNRRLLLGSLACVPFLGKAQMADAATVALPWVNGSCYGSPQAAINAAPAGAAVVFPRGTYVGDITVTKSLTIAGEGNPPNYLNGLSGDIAGTGTILAGRLHIEPSGNSLIHVSLRDLGVKGGIRMRAATALGAINGWSMSNVRVWESPDHGIKLEGNVFEGHMVNVGSHQNALDGLHTEDIAGGIVGEVQIDGSRFFANGGRGVYLASGGDITIGSISCSYNQLEGFVSYGMPFNAATIHLEKNALDGTTGRAAWLYTRNSRIGAMRINHAGVDADGVDLTGCLGVRIGHLNSNATGSRKDLLIDGNSLRCTIEDYWPYSGVPNFENNGYQCEVRQGPVLLDS